MNTILFHKEKSAYFAKKSSRAMNKMMLIRKKRKRSSGKSLSGKR